MATISRLSVALTASTRGLKKGLGKARGMVKRFTSKIANIKTALVGAFAVLGAGALASSSLDAFAKQERAVTSFDESLKSMGRTTKDLGPQIKALASRIQAEGIIGDEAILEGAAFLSTYSDITDAMLPRTIRAMVDLAAKMGGSTTNAAKLLGKASMGLVGTLSIAGISLSDATKKSKNFEDILTEIEQQVGGVNAALGGATSGALAQFGNAWGDIKEKIGEVLATAIGPFIRLFAQEMATATFNAKAMGETLRDWLIATAKSMSVLIDLGTALAGVWQLLKGGFFGLVTAVLFGANAIAKGANGAMALLGKKALFSNDEMMKLEATMDRFKEKTKANALGGIDNVVDGVGDLLSATGSSNAQKFEKEIDEIANKAAVAEMKSRLGIAGGPNVAAEPTRVDTGPQIVTDPQLETTNARLQTIIDVFGRGAVAQ